MKGAAMHFARILTAMLLTTGLVWQTMPASADTKLPIDGEAANPHQNPYEARSFPDRLEIFKGGMQISVIRCENPNIERWGFIDSGKHVVVRSRTEHQSVVLELFDTASGIRADRVLVFEHKKSKPAWASGFAD
jgi:hypothetical protein